ncbi:MAG: hypothetical protein RL173_188 [Fibrobacterota bacterium]|jgi:uncharacterized protein (TIGR02147 family)
MHRVYSYLDYRAYLQDEQAARKEAEPGFTSRKFASQLEIDPGQLTRVLGGKSPLPFRFVPIVSELFGMDRRAAAYFEELLRLERARSQDEKNRCQERLAALRGVAVSPVDGAKSEYYAHWYHSVVRALLGLGPFRDDFAALGRMCIPPITSEQARKAVEILEELGFVRRDPDQVLRPAEPHLTSGEGVSPVVLRQFHDQAILLAREALERIPASEREISAVTASVDAKGLALLREMAKELRQRIQTLAHGTREPDRVFQLNIQMFPVGAWAAEDAR